MARTKKQNAVSVETQNDATATPMSEDPQVGSPVELDAELEAALEALEPEVEPTAPKIFGADVTETPPATDEADDADEAPADFTEILQAVEAEAVELTVAKLNLHYDVRSDFEKAKNGFNENIQDTLKKERARMTRPGLAAILAACDVDPSFVNREEHTGKRFNVYALGKINDVIYGVSSGGHFKNAINLAVMRSLFRARKAGIAFTGALAQAAASDKVSIDKAISAVLIRHTVSASTAPTQSSSTMNALEVLGIVTNRGSDKYPLYELTDAPITRKIEQLLAA